MNFDRIREFGERIQQLSQRVFGYAQSEPFTLLFEFALIWVVVYFAVRFLRGTRGAWAIKGVAVILITGTVLIQFFGFERLNFLYANFLQIATLMLVIVFQPELRRALVRLGETRLFNKQTGLRRAQVVQEIVASVEYLSKRKIGALIAIEREVGLRGIVEQGTHLNADVSRELLDTIFWPNSKLHDLGVVIQGDKLLAAGVQFPLAEAGTLAAELGSRHRAAVGLSQETDALIVVVSEESGKVSLAERGNLDRGLAIDDLRTRLTRGLTQVVMDAELDAELDDDLTLPDDEPKTESIKAPDKTAAATPTTEPEDNPDDQPDGTHDVHAAA